MELAIWWENNGVDLLVHYLCWELATSTTSEEAELGESEPCRRQLFQGNANTGFILTLQLLKMQWIVHLRFKSTIIILIYYFYSLQQPVSRTSQQLWKYLYVRISITVSHFQQRLWSFSSVFCHFHIHNYF